jgi:Flp pilus assembly protein TadD
VLDRGRPTHEATLAWTSFLALRPGVAAAYLHRGYAWERAQEPDAARADFFRALALDPALSAAQAALERVQAAKPGEP